MGIKALFALDGKVALILDTGALVRRSRH